MPASGAAALKKASSCCHSSCCNRLLYIAGEHEAVTVHIDSHAETVYFLWAGYAEEPAYALSGLERLAQKVIAYRWLAHIL